MTRLSLILVALLGACASVETGVLKAKSLLSPGYPETRALAEPLPEIQRPVLRALRSMEVEDLITGERQALRINRFGNGIRVREPDGCLWTRSYDWFAPSDSFAHCGASKKWRTAQARVSREEAMFPLRLGANAQYRRRAVSGSGAVSERETTCQAIDAVTVRRPGRQGSVDTPAYVVACTDGRIERITWYAPGLGPIAYREAHLKKGLREAWVRVD